MLPQVTAFGSVGDIMSLGGTILTDLARVYEQFSDDCLADFFPIQTTLNTNIVIERVREGVGIAPLVTPGQNDVMTDQAQVERMTVVPAYLRESDFLTSNVINDLRQVGTINEKMGKEIVAMRIRRLQTRFDSAWALFRALMLLGGVAYTDPRTKTSINVSANIPSSNLYAYNGSQAYTGWSNQASATPLKNLIEFRQQAYNIAKVEPKYLVMTSDLRTILQNSAEVLKRQEVSFLSQTGYVKIVDGKLVQMAGMDILTFDRIYQDPANPGTVKKIWPINKVAMLAKTHPTDTQQHIGRLQKCIGEDPMGRPGLWVRSGPDTVPPSAPGRSVQMGDSGLPYLIYPDWVSILTVDTVNNLTAIVNNAVTNPF